MNGQKSIGILGGGQLARMTVEAAMRLGVRCHVLDKSGDCPAAPYTPFFTLGNALDFDTVLRFAASCDAVTIDSEHVNADALSELERQGKLTAPQGRVLKIIQNKCRQKEFLAAEKIPTARFCTIQSREALVSLGWTFPLVQKTATAGYDGNGVKVLKTATDIATAFAGESLIEEKVSIAKEIAVIVATGGDGRREIYEPVEMVFDGEKNILKYQLCPADISPAQTRHAQAIAVLAAEKLGVRGLLAVEMFLTTGGEILVNEMAPRPHNSGHHTIEAAVTSQYDNLVRIVLGLPLGSPATTMPSLMMNLLGPEAGGEAEFQEMLARAHNLPQARVHWYGKRDIRPYRKLGHITLTGERLEIDAQYRKLAAAEK